LNTDRATARSIRLAAARATSPFRVFRGQSFRRRRRRKSQAPVAVLHL